MVEYESMGILDNIGYARLYTERFIIFVDGKDVGIYDEWEGGRIFAKDNHHKSWHFDCTEKVANELKAEYPDADFDDEFNLLCFYKRDFNNDDVERIVARIRHLSKLVA